MWFAVKFCIDLEHKRKTVDQLWIDFETLGTAYLQPRRSKAVSQTRPSTKPIGARVLGDETVALYIDRINQYRMKYVGCFVCFRVVDHAHYP